MSYQLESSDPFPWIMSLRPPQQKQNRIPRPSATAFVQRTTAYIWYPFSSFVSVLSKSMEDSSKRNPLRIQVKEETYATV
jgi:hypothetical protein